MREALHHQSAQQEGGYKIEDDMLSYNELVELARICLKQAGKPRNPLVRAELRQLAKGYQVRAASMDNGRFPDIGELSEVSRESCHDEPG
jgi:hypothetical protein